MILMIKCAKLIVVPVLPIPALQCMTALWLGSELKVKIMNLLSITEKASIAIPLGAS